MVHQKILIVDDSRMIRMQVQDMLPKGNIEVLEAKDGAEGFDLVNVHHPTVVVLDFFMPKMNGWEVVQKMEANPELQAIPVVMMSGRKEDVVATVPELFEYFEFLSKPFEAPALMKAIKAAVTKAKTRQRSPISAKSQHPPAADTAPKSMTPTTTDPDVLHQLQSEIAALKQQNVKLHAEVAAMKKQMSQIVTIIRQKLK